MLLFAVYFAGLNLEEKNNFTMIHWNFLGIFTLLTLSYFYSAHIFVCMYIFMSIFSCLIVHVLHCIFFLNIWNFLYKKQFLFLI